MASGESSVSATRVSPTVIIMVLLLPHLPGMLFFFPRYAFTQSDVALSIFAVALALFTLLTFAGLWLRKDWALWATLVLVACKATIDLFALSQKNSLALTLASLLVLVVIAVLVFVMATPPTRRVSVYQRALFASVLAFAAWVAVWGLFFPEQIASRLPLTVPPLHARFLGAMYLAGSVFVLLAMLAKNWHEIRVVTMILALWTGMLGAVSIANLDALDWSRGPLWFWFVAYLGFPLIALWVAWCQRAEMEHPHEDEISPMLRAYLYGQGVVASVLALCLLAAPQFMTTVWPWPVAALVAHIYGAPFLAFGIGSLYAARQRAWSEVRITIMGTLVFALGVLTASLVHAGLFDPSSPSVWLWFGGFGLATGLLVAFALVPALRLKARGSGMSDDPIRSKGKPA